jgi:Ca-activated chloride channel family protein
VEERETAFELYDGALTRGDGGYLLDEERPNIFTLSVGNLKPGAEAVVEIEYVTLLDMEGEKVRFFLPTTISPRYVPNEMPEENGIPENDKINPVYAEEVPYGFSLHLSIHEGTHLQSVESPTHPVRVDMSGEIFQASLSSDSVKMDRDFILYMGYKAPFMNRAYRLQVGDETFIQVDFKVEDEPRREMKKAGGKEVIFVLDCSGSMEGDSLQEAKKAVEICLKSLDEETYFNIYCFGSDFQHLFQGPERYTAGSLEKALGYLVKVRADLGGTEVLKPLTHIYANPPKAGINRSIVLLTDGEIGNEGQVLELVRRHRTNIRFFPVGIGSGPNEFLIKGLARAGRGACEFIYPGERIEPKVLRAFQKLEEEALEDVAGDWGVGSLEQVPKEPLCYSGSPVSIFARQAGGEAPQGKVLKIHGKIAGVKKEWEIPFSDQGEGKSLPIPVLWARERIRELEEGGNLSIGGSRQRERKETKIRDTIIELSKKYSLLSTMTSFVAVEEREEKEKSTGEIVLRKVPALVTIGWHGLGRMISPAASMNASIMMSYEPAVREEMSSLPFIEDAQVFNYPALARRVQSSKTPQKTDLLMDILSLQSAQGGLPMNERVAKQIGYDLKKIQELASAMELEIPEDKFLVLSTAILLQVLRAHFLPEEISWKRVIQKSEAWFQKVLKSGRPRLEGRELSAWAEEFVRKIKI